MPIPESDLAGSWRKLSSQACAAAYPLLIHFSDDGRYRAEAANPGDFILWDLGSYRIEPPDSLHLSTANDAIIRYRWQLRSDHFTVTTPDQCVLEYQRL